jgi:hypothetical protein
MSTRVPLSERDFELLLVSMHLRSKLPDNQYIRAHFGVSIKTLTRIWDTCSSNNLSSKPEHLLWTLQFLKTYETEEILSNTFGVSRKTYRKWVWIMVKSISDSKKRVVSIFIINSILIF